MRPSPIKVSAVPFLTFLTCRLSSTFIGHRRQFVEGSRFVSSKGLGFKIRELSL